MVKVGVVAMLFAAGVGRAVASDLTPLLPHPAERFKRGPVYSQDKYKRDPIPNEPGPDEQGLGERLPPEQEPPKYSQDKYSRPETPEDYSDELRKTPSKNSEQSELEIAKGMVKLNAKQYDAAISNFQKAFRLDPRNFLALEYIAAVHEHKGDFGSAVAFLAKAKHIAPQPRWGQINFQIGRLYLLAKNFERAEIYLRLALKEGGQATAVNYTLGYLFYLEERFFEAEHYLHEARMKAIRRTAFPVERQMLQAINYYLGEIYARLGYIQYAVTMLRNTEVGESWEVRQGAWRVHSEINHPNWYASLGLFNQFDSNVVLVPVGGDLPTEFSNQSSLGFVMTSNLGWQTSPAKRWVFGVDGATYFNYHLNSTLASFDVFDWAIGGWANFWNQADWSFLARLDFNDALTDRNEFTRFQSAAAATASLTYMPFQRWNWEMGFQYRMNDFATDVPNSADQRSGRTYVGFLRATLKAPNPRFKPTLGYRIEVDATDGQNFQARSHVFSLEADWRLFSRSHAICGLHYTRTSYPNHVNGRSDAIIQARLGLSHSFSEHWMGIADVTQIEDDSTLKDFSYKRMIMTGGVSYTF